MLQTSLIQLENSVDEIKANQAKLATAKDLIDVGGTKVNRLSTAGTNYRSSRLSRANSAQVAAANTQSLMRQALGNAFSNSRSALGGSAVISNNQLVTAIETAPKVRQISETPLSSISARKSRQRRVA